MILVLKKVKSPYFTSVARNSNVTHKPEDDAWCAHFTPNSLFVLRVFETTPKYTERKGSVAERLERWTCNSEAPSSSLALTTSWICSR